MEENSTTNRKPIERGSIQHKILNFRLMFLYNKIKRLERKFYDYSHKGIGYADELKKCNMKLLKLNEKRKKLTGY